MLYYLGMKKTIPANIKKLFWDVDKESLDVTNHQKSIVERVLNYGQLSDWRWLITTYGIPGVQKVLSAHGIFLRTNIRERARRLFSLLVK